MDANPAEPDPPEASISAGMRAADRALPSVFRAMWIGGKIGFRWGAFFAGSIVGVVVIASFSVTALGVGAGRGWGVPPIAMPALGAFLVVVVWGTIVGALVGLFVGVIQRLLPKKSRLSGASVFNRPISLMEQRGDSGFVASAPPGFLRSRWPWLIGAPVFLFLVAALAIGLYLKPMVERRLAASIAVADHDDPYWRLDDLIAHREVVPDAENSALVLAEANALLPENWPAPPKPQLGHPIPQPSEAAKASERLPAIADNERLDDVTAEALRGDLAKYDQAVAIARSVADYRRGRHELEIGRTIIDTLLTETQAARPVARFLAADAAIRAHDGELDGALDSCRAILGTARSIGDEPFAISQFVRIAIGSVAMRSSVRVLGQGEPSDAALARLQSLILDELDQPLLVHGLRGERAGLVELIRRLGAGEVPISALSEGGPPFDLTGPGSKIAPWGKLWFDQQRAVALEWMNDAVAIARRPDSEHPARWNALQANIDRVRRSRFGPYTAMLPILLVPPVSTSSSAHARHHCELGATAILLAAERHRRKMGDWPASIAAIDQTIMANAPNDPFSGEPFRMERRDGQLLIYSIGPNLQDEHGAYDPKKWTKGGPDDTGASAWDVPLRRQARRSQPPGPNEGGSAR
jgi:hypothetical protein